MVSTALYTGLSGLQAHQAYIDVIGNNLANVSTAGFRGSRATFSDLLSLTTRTGAAPNGTFGGTNPLQIGTGTQMASVDMDLSQGTLQDTGRSLDVALQGRGFFTLSNGSQTFYSRVGSFGIDANRTLVDLRTGLRVVDSSGGDITVPTSGTQPAQPTSNIDFQGNLPAEVSGPLEEIVQSSSSLQQGTAATKVGTAGGASAPLFDLTALAGETMRVSVNGGAQQSLTVPSTAAFTGGPVSASVVATWMNDNLDGVTVTPDDTAGTLSFETVRLGTSATLKFDNASSANDVLGALGLNAVLASGTQTAATGTTDLQLLTARDIPYADGDAITVSGTNPDGTAFSDTFVYGTGNDGTTIDQLLSFINANANGATASLTAEGNIRLTSDEKGEADLSLFLGDVNGNTGSVNWASFAQTQDGTGPDTAITSIDIVDSRGRTHPVSLTFTRTTDDSSVWNLQATMDAAEGTITQNSLGQIRFNDDGSFNVIGGGSNTLAFQWDGIGEEQSVTIRLGTSGQFDGIAMLGAATTIAAVDQDGFAAGSLLNVGFNANGELVGFYSNGQNEVLDTLRISMFGNEGGLVRAGDTLFTASPNSDTAIATTANAAGAGSVRSGQLENSNVDIAREFVNLIEAQRGFQANSRVITTTDEILAELMNIVR